MTPPPMGSVLTSNILVSPQRKREKITILRGQNGSDMMHMKANDSINAVKATVAKSTVFSTSAKKLQAAGQQTDFPELDLTS